MLPRNLVQVFGQFCAVFAILILSAPHLTGQPKPDSLSDIITRGGEIDRIHYYYYTNRGDLTASTSAKVWSFAVRDGGQFSPDSDPYPTALDSFSIRVRMASNPLSINSTGTFSWCGLFSADSQLVAEAEIWDTTFVFKGLTAAGATIPDDSTKEFFIAVKFNTPSNLGEKYSFSIGPGMAVVRDPGTGTSYFGNYPTVMGDTTGDLNRIVTVSKTIRLAEDFKTVPKPNARFDVQLIIVDTLGWKVVDPPDTISVSTRAKFGSLGGTLARTDTGSIYDFNDLTYPYRNNYLELVFTAPGLDSLLLPVVISGGAPEIPTVTNLLQPSRDTTVVIDGVQSTIRFQFGVSRGSFLTERFERMPANVPPMPINITTIAPRFLHLTADDSLVFLSSYVLGVPTTGLPSSMSIYEMMPIFRVDSTLPWESPVPVPIGYEDGEVFARFTSFGQIGLGTIHDVALPVELVEFIAANDAEGVMLQWRTASEVDNEGFVLSRGTSPNGTFTTIATHQVDEGMRGLGTSPFGRKYNWLDRDHSLKEGVTYYYKLFDEKRDGILNEHGPVAITFERASQTGLLAAGTIHPNPFVNSTAIEIEAEADDVAEVIITNTLGQEVSRFTRRVSEHGRSSLLINTGALPPGSYFITVHVGGTLLRRLATRVSG
jgi:hypothetical protein